MAVHAFFYASSPGSTISFLLQRKIQVKSSYLRRVRSCRLAKLDRKAPIMQDEAIRLLIQRQRRFKRNFSTYLASSNANILHRQLMKLLNQWGHCCCCRSLVCLLEASMCSSTFLVYLTISNSRDLASKRGASGAIPTGQSVIDYCVMRNLWQWWNENGDRHGFHLPDNLNLSSISEMEDFNIHSSEQQACPPWPFPIPSLSCHFMTGQSFTVRPLEWPPEAPLLFTLAGQTRKFGLPIEAPRRQTGPRRAPQWQPYQCCPLIQNLYDLPM